MEVLDQPMIDMTVRSGTPRTSSTVAAVAGVVEPGVAYAGALQQRLPFVVVGVGDDRTAGPAGEDPTAFSPQRAGVDPFGALLLAVFLKQHHQFVGQPDHPVPRR